ncbi:hypothetical protein [Natronorubrum sp. FCH18a]|uniref:hypothetical protein n=1 Tax=Natronorubrum sp. FCH18a TaxID=3447018 RepID=UPI003F5131FC
MDATAIDGQGVREDSRSDSSGWIERDWTVCALPGPVGVLLGVLSSLGPSHG